MRPILDRERKTFRLGSATVRERGKEIKKEKRREEKATEKSSGLHSIQHTTATTTLYFYKAC